MLLDLADVTIEPDGTMIARYRQVYKLFNSRTRDLAEVNLPYNSSYQRLHVLSAQTIQKDGMALKVSPAEFRPLAQYSNYLLYDDVRGIGFSLPGITDNCIIDYRWEEVTRPLLMPSQFWLSWAFSGPSPVGYSRMTLHYPTRKSIHVAMHNTQLSRPTVLSKVQGDTTTTVWEAARLEPLSVEPMMPDWDEVMPRVEVSSISTWQEVARRYWHLQHPQAAPSPELKVLAARLTAGRTTPEQKARALYAWVSRTVRYVGLEFGLSAIRPHPATKVATNLYGDCKDKATLMIALLGEAGIKAYPTLLNTEMHTVRTRNLPALDAFDHCIAVADVGGKEVWLDATVENYAYGDIPEMDRGAQALVVSGRGGEWKTIPACTPEESDTNTVMQVSLQSDSSARITLDLTWRGRAKQEMQDTLADLSPEECESLMKKIAASLSAGTALEQAVCRKPLSDTEPVSIHLECTAPHWAKRVGDLLLVPVANALSVLSERKFAEENRTWPIVQRNASTQQVQIMIFFPADTRIEGLPAEINEAGPFQTYERHFQRTADGKSLTVSMRYQERIGTLPKEKYVAFREYSATMAAWNGDQLVLSVGH